MKSISKVVLFAYLGEKIFETLGNKTEQYPKIREALDFILDYLKNNQIYEEKIYECLDDESYDAILNDILEINIISGNTDSLLRNIDCYFENFRENYSFDKQKEWLENNLI